MRMNLSGIAVGLVCGAFFACGGSTSDNNTGPATTSGDDGGVTTTPVGDDGGGGANNEAAAPVDNGAPSTMYPAFPPAMGQLMNNGGYVMKNPVIVPITWNTDPSQATYDSFADTVGGTSYWKTASSEYGVGPATSGASNHMHMTTAFTNNQVTDSELPNLVAMYAGASAGDAGAGAWPAPTQDTIYAFFLPPGVSLQMSTGQGSGTADACQQGVGGYHDEVTVGGVTTSYAVVPSCNFGGGNTAEQQTTMSMSHELLEAVTDPHPQDNPGWTGFEDNSFAFDWFQEFQSENGDACELFQSSFYEEKETTPASFDYWVQRTWSNASGKAGHNPCVPVQSGPYFNVTPLALESVNVTLPAQFTGSTAQTYATKGFHIALGQSATFQVGFYSDADTGGPWTISFSYGSPIGQSKPTYLTATADKMSGVNGEKSNVTVKVNSVGSLKAELLVVKSTMNGQSHEMPIVIGSE